VRPSWAHIALRGAVDVGEVVEGVVAIVVPVDAAAGAAAELHREDTGVVLPIAQHASVLRQRQQ
jgi:hypothetical protein